MGMVGYGYELIVGNAKAPATPEPPYKGASAVLDIWRPEGRNTNRHFPGKPNGGEIKTVGAGADPGSFLPSSGARQPRVSLDLLKKPSPDQPSTCQCSSIPSSQN
ncbi:hypothetical protein TNCV_1294971 [Trichonephila clavipes]|nr:hypothetical protein TNCV_1294971 [Trichonephila clavipes]